MTKREFLHFLAEESHKGAVRFSIGFTTKGQVVMYWTTENGIRAWRVLSSNRGKRPTEASRKKAQDFKRWLKELA